MKVAVIGGGPSGLVTLKYLVTAHEFLGCEPVEVLLLECQPQVGGTFAARTYEDAELVSSKQLTTFSDFRLAGPDFLSTDRYVKYLEDYCTHFNLWPYIKLNADVTAVTQRSGGGHTVAYEVDGRREEWVCDAIAVCSGLHVTPNMPEIPGIENLPNVMHSTDFKGRSQFGVGKTVMVVGTGETGMDVAYLAVTSPTRQVLMCHRDGFHFAPKMNQGPVILPILGRKPNPKKPGVPTDVSRANLFDTTYVHPALRNHIILWDWYYWTIKIIIWLGSGASAGNDQWIGEISKERHHPSKIFYNKSMKVCPYISLPYRPKLPGPKLWLYTLRSLICQAPILDTKGRQVDLAPWPERVDSSGVVQFRNNGRPEYERVKDLCIRPDIVVLCTGYTQTFPFFNHEGKARHYPVPSEADVRGIWKRDEPSVGFIGFVRPSLGAIPPLSEMQAQLWVLNLLQPRRVPELRPEDEPHYQLSPPPGSRINYGVDHESYAYQLAMDVGGAPGLTDALRMAVRERNWRLLVIWGYGAHLNTKFRLQGPWEWDGAADLLTSDELWQTITRRPIVFGHFAISILPIFVFGPMSLLVFLYVTMTTFFGAGERMASTTSQKHKRMAQGKILR